MSKQLLATCPPRLRTDLAAVNQRSRPLEGDMPGHLLRALRAVHGPEHVIQLGTLKLFDRLTPCVPVPLFR